MMNLNNCDCSFSMMPRIYLHIFDRELRNFCQSQMTDKDISEIVLMACLLSDEVYVPYSNLMESFKDYPNSVQLVIALEREHLCRIIASEGNYESFLYSHQYLYFNVKDRYPMYYGNQVNLFPAFPYVPFRDTTSVLREKISKSLENGVPLVLCDTASNLHRTITDANNGAVTIANISQVVNLNPEQKHEVARLISSSYSKRYLDEICGTYIAGLPYLNSLDSELGTSTIRYSFYLDIFRHFFFNKWYDPLLRMYEPTKMQYELLFVKNDERKQEFLALLMRCADAICSHPAYNETDRQRELRSIISTLTVKPYSFEEVYAKLLLKQRVILNNGVHMDNNEKNEKTVLLVVATDLELQVVTQFYKNKGNKLVVWDANGTRFCLLGKTGNCIIHLVRCSMGSHGPMGSIMTINKAVEGLHPDFMVMVGIAYGIKKEIKMGDVMISTSIIDGDLGKAVDNKQKEMEFQPRGLNSPADMALWQAFATTHSVLNLPYSVYTGTIVSASIVVNSKKKLAEVISNFPQAIGGEMEGIGLSATQSVPWILVKAACDKGKNKTDEYQILAAHNAIEYVDCVFSTL